MTDEFLDSEGYAIEPEGVGGAPPFEEFGADALMGDIGQIPFSDEEFRYYATISRSKFALYMSEYIARCRLSKRAKTSLNHILASFFDDNVVLSNNKTILEAVYRFDLATISLKTALTDHDVKSREWTVIMTTLRSQFEFMITRTIGGESTRERLLQHARTTVQRMEQATAPRELELTSEKKKGLFNF